MKNLKITLLISVILLNITSCNAAGVDSVKKFFHKPSAQEVNLAKEAAADNELTLSEQAFLYYNDGDSRCAFETILKIEEAERTAQDWVILGNILQDENKISDAIFMYQRAILINPKYYKAYYNLANIYLEEEKYYLAIENYRKANKANNEFSYAYYNLGCAYLKIGDLKKAKIAFLKAIELKNTVANFHYNLAYTYKKLNKPKLAKQYLEFYNKLMENSQNID